MLLGTLSLLAQPSETTSITIDKKIVSEKYIGNGVQWDPYALNYGKGKVEISEKDWQKIYSRLDYMRPQFIRLMVNTSSQIRDGKFDPTINFEGNLKNLLDYCQSRNVTVMFGDWGGHMVHPNEDKIDVRNLGYAADYVKFLLDNGYTCIKYYNMINEPNGYWSSNIGKYDLWASAMRQFQKEMIARGLNSKVGIVGPDAAIWTANEAWWIDSCATKLNGMVELYDIHTYPSKITVNSGEYSNIIRAYKEKVPAGKQIVMGEIGFKYIEKADSIYDKSNKKKIAAKPWASPNDSQMFVYEHMYGTDMADALFQTMNEGYSGSIIWMLDDAMHYNEAPNLLKIWGFWNILAEEQFGSSQDEQVRPFFYAWSLLSKYIPQGAKVYTVNTTGVTGVRAVAIEHNGKHTIAVVNVTSNEQKVNIKSSSLKALKNLKQYHYYENEIIRKGDCEQLPNKVNVSLNLKKGEAFTIPSNGLLVLTNLD